MRFTLRHRGVQIASHSLISEQAKFDLGANVCRNAATTAFRLGCMITTGTPFRPQNVYWDGVPVLCGDYTTGCRRHLVVCNAYARLCIPCFVP